MASRVCKECGYTKREKDFPKVGKYRRRTCSKCWYKLRVGGDPEAIITCAKCGKPKNAGKFDGTRYQGGYECMACRNRRLGYQYQKRYGASVELYEKLLRKQKGCCALCKKKESHTSRAKLSFNHCHKTGKIRGLLCHRCNVALGLFGDDPDLMRRAARYVG